MTLKSLPRIKKKLLTALDIIFCAFMFHLDNASLADLHRLYYRKSIQYTKGLPRLQKLVDDVDTLSINWLMLAREANIGELPEDLENYIFHSLQRIYENSIRPYTDIISKLETIYTNTFNSYAPCLIDRTDLNLISSEINKNKLFIRAIEEKHLYIKQKLENKEDELLDYEDRII